MGFVAEEVSEVDPLLVTYDDHAEEAGVKYWRITALLTKAIQELHDELEKQQEEIEFLRKELKRTNK